MLSICSFPAKLRVNKLDFFLMLGWKKTLNKSQTEEIMYSTISVLIQIYQYPALLLLVLTSDCMCLSIPPPDVFVY